MICLLGATATGKTRLAVALGKLTLVAEIISADSRQVYRGLDIGSGKDLDEYDSTPHHLIDIVDPGHEFNVFEFVLSYNDALDKIQTARASPPIVGWWYWHVSRRRSERLISLTVRNPEHVPQRYKIAKRSSSSKINYVIYFPINTTLPIWKRERE